MMNDDVPRLIIYCGGIHEGGGLSLLNDLLKSIPDVQDVIVLANSRVVDNLQLPNHGFLKTYSNKILSKLLVELWLYRNAKSIDLILCLGNLPPLLKLKSTVFTYIQNRYLVDDQALRLAKGSKVLNLLVQKIWLKVFLGNSDHFIVQTEGMKLLLQRKFKQLSSVMVWPYSSFMFRIPTTLDVVKKKMISFIYPASGGPHKNHHRLVDAWVILAEKNIYPKLVLTLDPKIFPDLCAYVDNAKNKYCLNIDNIGFVDSDAIKNYYKESDALIYPSQLESFGIPIIEAASFQLPIIASELDYVRDLGIPILESFDPESSISIARAVMRALGNSCAGIDLLTPTDFYCKLIEYQR